jgi:hypothetical protein
MKQDGTISKTEAIHQVAAQMDKAMNLDDFINRALEIWPSYAKNPQASVKQTIRDEHLGKDLLFLDENTLIPMQQAMAGIRFRIPLTRQEINRGWLFIYPGFQFMNQREVTAEDFYLEDDKGQTIPFNPVTVKNKIKTIFGVQEYEQTAFDLGQWYEKHKLRRGDSLLITILNWERSHFCLQPESSRTRQQHEAEIQRQNQALADHLFRALENARFEYIWGQVAIPTAYLHLKDANAYPPDHWYEILEKDPRMRWTGVEIHYADWSSPLENIFNDVSSPTTQSTSSIKYLSKEQKNQVYRFKAFLWHRKGLWRRIEIQGGQTLADFDRALRDAFEHDTFDHLSGFWKLTRRGRSHRFREIDLGNINPFEGGEAADILVSSLEIEPGDALKYVYDFGDWIEHRIELEAIVEPEKDAKYPQIVGQNKARYRYCHNCKKTGKKVIAAWICITCCNRLQEDLFLCETCADRDHEDHYTEEILY